VSVSPPRIAGYLASCFIKPFTVSLERAFTNPGSHYMPATSGHIQHSTWNEMYNLYT